MGAGSVPGSPLRVLLGYTLLSLSPPNSQTFAHIQKALSRPASSAVLRVPTLLRGLAVPSDC